MMARLSLAFCFLAASVVTLAQAQTLVEQSHEARFQLDVKVPEAALAAYLPTGWTPDVATSGAAKDCNLRVIFIDRVTINGPDGAPLGRGSHRVVILEAPVRNLAGERVRLIIGGLTDDPGNVPGPFGNFILADTHGLRRTTAESGAIIDTQDWVFKAASGEHLEMHIEFERNNATIRRTTDRKTYSATNPDFYQLSNSEYVLDIMRNVTTNPPDHVRAFAFEAGGGSFSALFPGDVPLLSWDNILWLNQEIFVP